MTITRDFDSDAAPRKPLFSTDCLRMFASNPDLSAGHHRLFRAIECFDRKYGEAASIEELAAVMRTSMEYVQQLAEELDALNAYCQLAANASDAGE